MDLVPQARRALLTAYADTNAAISAINVVDVDHYLLKPWEPPEEKLYPVVDDLLDSWRREGRTPVHKIKILGHPWSAASYEVRDFLARNQVPYRWYRIDEPDGERMVDRRQRRPHPGPDRDHRRRHAARAAVADRAGRRRRVEHDPGGRLLRRDHHRRRTGRSGRGRLRRIGGSADRGDRAQCRWRTGRAELADRELPGLSRRRLGRSADRPGPPSGLAVRGRDPHRAYGGRPEREGPGARGRTRRRLGDRGTHRRAGERGQLPAPRRVRGRRPRRPRDLLRIGRDRGGRLRRRPRADRRRGQLGRAGRRVLRPARAGRDPGGAWGLPRALDVVLPRRSDPLDRQHRRCGSTPRSASATGKIICSASP